MPNAGKQQRMRESNSGCGKSTAAEMKVLRRKQKKNTVGSKSGRIYKSAEMVYAFDCDCFLFDP